MIYGIFLNYGILESLGSKPNISSAPPSRPQSLPGSGRSEQVHDQLFPRAKIHAYKKCLGFRVFVVVYRLLQILLADLASGRYSQSVPGLLLDSR